MKNMKILVSNDDGYEASGIKSLARALQEIAEITIVAPDRNRSGASNSLTLESPIRAVEVENAIYRVDGTPTDCVHLAITGLLQSDPDMVVRRHSRPGTACSDRSGSCRTHGVRT